MQRMVTVLAAEPGEHQLAVIGLAVAVGVLNETHVRFLAHVHAAIAEFKRQRNVQVIGKHRGLVRATVAVGILQNHQLIVRLIAGVHVRIGRRAAHPHASLAIPAHLDRAGDFRKLLLAREEIHLKARIYLERLQLIGRAHPFIGPATCCRGRQRRDVGIINVRRHRFALRQIPNAPVPVLHHDVEVAHSRQEIQIAVAAIATTGVIKRVHRSVAPEELLVLFDHRRAHRLVHRRPLATDEGLRKQRLREYFVSRLVQVTAVDRQVGAPRSHRLLRGREHICKAHPLRCRHLAHHLGIRRDILVVPIRRRHALHVFIRNRRHQHNPRPTLTIKRLRLQTRHVRGEFLAKLR